MSVDLHLNIAGDAEARQRIRDKVAQCHPHRVATRVAVPTARHWRRHLAGLPRNKHGYPSTGFWEDAARRVVGAAVANAGGFERGSSVLLTSDKLGLKQRLHGGTIRARNHKYLTIPICAEAYGTRVADWGFENLTLVVLGGKKFFALWVASPDVERKLSRTVEKALSAVYKRRARYAAAGRRTTVSEAQNVTKQVNVFRKTTAFSKPDVLVGKAAVNALNHRMIVLLFVLKTEVNQAANPDVIPFDIADVAIEAVEEAVK